MRYISIAFVLLFLLSCKDQQSNIREFKPVDISIIKSLKFENITVEHTYSSAQKNNFNTIYELTEYFSELNSLREENYGCNECRDSIPKKMFFDKIEGIRKTLVLRHDSLRGKKVIVYYSGKLDDGGWGCWIAIKDTNSSRWQHYYTGITNNKIFHLKPKSTLPLFYNDSIIQIEAALVREIEEPILPETIGKCELVEDSLLLKINLYNTIIDSDSDGLTDIVEKKYMTDSKNPDTDGDGIKDAEDKNPRFESDDNKFSLLINFLLDGEKKPRGSKYFIDFKNLDFKYYHDTLSLYKVVMLITNDKRIEKVDFQNKTYLVIDRDEYFNIDDMISTPYTCFISIEKVKYNEFRVYISESISGTTYAVKKTRKGWLIREESSYII